jgi:ABC-type glycerol-3-phosphate transport system substrate-binding protein
MRTIARVLIVTVLTAVISSALAVAATASEELTTKEFLRQANAICDRRNQKADAISAQLLTGLTAGESPSAAQIASFVERTMPIYRRALAKLDALDGPDALEQKLDKVVAVYATAGDGIEADPQAFWQEPGELLYKPDALAGKIGIDCAGDYYADGVGPPVRR